MAIKRKSVNLKPLVFNNIIIIIAILSTTLSIGGETMRSKYQHRDQYEQDRRSGQHENGDKRHRHKDYAEEREHWPDDDDRR